MTQYRTLFVSALLMCTVGVGAQPMSDAALRDNARYLTDRMAHDLALGAGLLDDLYCINYDFIYGVNDYLDDVAVGYRLDDYNAVLAARDLALQRLLTPAQWAALVAIDYFWRPICFASRRWFFGIYHYLPFTGHWYFHAPSPYAHYRGGRFFGGMSPEGGHAPGYQHRSQGGASAQMASRAMSQGSQGRTSSSGSVRSTGQGRTSGTTASSRTSASGRSSTGTLSGRNGSVSSARSSSTSSRSSGLSRASSGNSRGSGSVSSSRSVSSPRSSTSSRSSGLSRASSSGSNMAVRSGSSHSGRSGGSSHSSGSHSGGHSRGASR